MKITYVLILICVIVFAFFAQFPPFEQDELFTNYGFSWNNLVSGRPWTIVTSLFVHGNLPHLLLNMTALFFFGRVLEEHFPPDKFLFIFFLGGLFGNIATIYFYPGEYVVGASAAIMAIMGVAMIKKPFELVFFPTLIPIPVLYAALVFIFSDVLAVFFGVMGDQSISHVGHLAGLSVGVVWGFFEDGITKTFLVLLLLVISGLFLLPMILQLVGIFDYTTLLGSIG